MEAPNTSPDQILTATASLSPAPMAERATPRARSAAEPIGGVHAIPELAP
jgi:hypothetical protein